MNRPDGMVSLTIPELGMAAGQWRGFERIVFDPKPLALEVACAHAALTGGVVVLAKQRGPRGGWTQVRFMRPEETPRRWRWVTAHVGVILS